MALAPNFGAPRRKPYFQERIGLIALCQKKVCVCVCVVLRKDNIVLLAVVNALANVFVRRGVVRTLSKSLLGCLLVALKIILQILIAALW